MTDTRTPLEALKELRWRLTTYSVVHDADCRGHHHDRGYHHDDYMRGCTCPVGRSFRLIQKIVKREARGNDC